MYLINGGAGTNTSSLHLSEQQLIACANQASGYGSDGCNGGYSNYVRGNCHPH